MSTGTLRALASEKHVLLTTFKRDGTAVPTPVWIVPDQAGLLVFTSTSTGKVKRIRHTSRVLLAPCDARGRVKPHALQIVARAALDQDPLVLYDLRSNLRRRYRVTGPLFVGVMTVLRKLGRLSGEDIAVRLTAL